MSIFAIDTLSVENKKAYYRLMAVISKGETESDCWNHTTSVSSNGYGQLCINAKLWNLHRLSWWLHNGCPEEPHDFYNRLFHVCHSCDNKKCANPEHLELKTAKINIEEAVNRIRVIKVKKTPIRTTVACNNCRADTHHKCDGFPCSQCVKKGLECIKEEYKITSGSFSSAAMSGEANIKCKLASKTIFEIREKVMKGLEYGGLKKMLKDYPEITYATLQAIAGRKTYRQEPEAIPPGWLEL